MANELMKTPICPKCGIPMQFRQARTNEQSFCGAWYDCWNDGCACSVLIPSKQIIDIQNEWRCKR